MIQQYIADNKYQPQVYYSLGYIYIQYSLTGVSVVVPAETRLYIEGVLRSILTSTVAVSNIVDSRVYWQKTPQAPTVPMVVFYSISDTKNPLYMSSDESKAQSGRLRAQFTCVSDDSVESLRLQQQVMNALRWFQGTTYGFTIETITPESMRQRIDPITNLYLNDVDMIVEYFES